MQLSAKKIPHYLSLLLSDVPFLLLCAGFKKVIYRLFKFKWTRYVLYSLDEPQIVQMLKSYESDDKVIRATVGDWDDPMALQELGPSKIDYLKNRSLNPEYDCVAYKRDISILGGVMCYGSMCYKRLEVNPIIQYKLPANEVFFFDDYCFTRYRRQGLYKKVMDKRFFVVQSQGYTRVTTIVATANRPSTKAHSDWKKEQRFYHYVFRGKEYCTLKSYQRV